MSMTPESTLDRRQLEDLWRSKLDQIQLRYKAATEEYRRLLGETPAGMPPASDGPLFRARQAESEALAEYARVLRVFTELTMNGTRPEEQSRPDLIVVIDDDKSVRNSLKTLLRST